MNDYLSPEERERINHAWDVVERAIGWLGIAVVFAVMAGVV